MALHKGPGGGGSRDDEEHPEIPGIDAPLSAGQKKAVDALKAFYKVKSEGKAARKLLKEAEDKALDQALSAIDAIGLEAGQLGAATFTTEIKRKLRVAIDERKRKPAGSGDEA